MLAERVLTLSGGPGLGTGNVREPATDLPPKDLSRSRESLPDPGCERVADAEREQVDAVSHGVSTHFILA